MRFVRIAKRLGFKSLILPSEERVCPSVMAQTALNPLPKMGEALLNCEVQLLVRPGMHVNRAVMGYCRRSCLKALEAM